METLLKLACPFTLTQAWQGLLFIAIPCILAALGARILRGSFLRIIGAVVGASLRDVVILILVASGHGHCNPDYNEMASLLLLFLTVSGAALGACLGPYRGLRLLLFTAVGALAGQWLFEPLSRHLLSLGLLALGVRTVRQGWQRLSLPH